jgi:trans-2,3-dihydro-3-hydroxyanthranilate isomerase
VTSNPRIYLVDVFARQRYSGNPLAVIASTEQLPAASMQQIAAEMNFSETTFVATAADADGGYAVRIFTPVREIAFTGHPILGTAWVIRHYLLQKSVDRVLLNIGLGQIPVDFEHDHADDEQCWFTAPPMSLDAIVEPGSIAPALGLLIEDIDPHTPVQVVSAGTAAIIVPLRDLDALQRGRLDLATFTPLAESGLPPLVYLYCRQARHPDNNLSARFFFEAREVREDPATGNGAAFLGAYLMHHDRPDGEDLRLRIEQGHELGRPSLVQVHAHRRDAHDEVRVGGRVIATVAGDLIDPCNTLRASSEA